MKNTDYHRMRMAGIPFDPFDKRSTELTLKSQGDAAQGPANYTKGLSVVIKINGYSSQISVALSIRKAFISSSGTGVTRNSTGSE